MSKERDEVYEFGDFRLDVGERKLQRLDGSSPGSLPEKAFQTLVHLVRHSGTLVEKGELLTTVWPDAVVEENNLGKAVHAIRQFLGEGNGTLKYVETVPKHGYRFVAHVKKLGHATAGNGHVTQAHDPDDIEASPLRSPAYDLYLRGKVKAGSENPEDTEAAIKVLEAAVVIDPKLAGAYAQLARAYRTLAFKFSSSSKAKRLNESAEIAILKALAIDPDLAEAHFARGLILWTKAKGFPHEQAIQSYKRAIELDPTDDETQHQLSMVYSHIGLVEEAQQIVKNVLELNPNNTMARFRVCVYTAYQGRFGEAIAAFKTIPRDVSPMLVDRCMAEALVQAGRTDDAEAIVDGYLKKNPQDEGGSFTSVKALLLAKSGKRKAAENAVEKAIEIGKDFGHFHHTAHNIASAYSALNEAEEAVKWLGAAADDGFPNYTYFQVDPNLYAIRSHPSFSGFMAQLKQRWEHFKTLV